MSFDHHKSLFFSSGLFLALFLAGILLSPHKLLWIDECYSYHVSIDHPSYTDILKAKFFDGNRCPLFYLIQKFNCNLFSLHYPEGGAEGIHDISDARAQIIMRIPSNIYMSLALACIFYFFIRFYSLSEGLYALAAALVTPMVWLYWLEARPYSLWFLLTTIQLLLLCCASIAPKIKIIKPLLLTHVLLAFTTPACILQISIACLVLWWRGKHPKIQLGLIGGLPIGIALLYLFLVPVFRTKTYDFTQNLFDAVLPERLFVYVIYVVTVWLVPEKYKQSSSQTFFLPVFLLFLASAVLMLFADVFTKNSQFGFFSRYLIFLTPADILMFSLASMDFRRWSRPNPWGYMNVSIALCGLMILRGLITYRTLLVAATYLHAPAWH